MTTVLLGPQRFRLTAGAVLAEVAPDGVVATVTAGWRDREKHDAELDEVMGGRSHNLHLWHRLGHVLVNDHAFAAAAVAYNRAVDEANSLYSLRLTHALESVYATMRHTAREDLRDSALRAGLQSVRDIDAWYIWLVGELEQDLRTSGGMDSSEVVAQHRSEIREILDGAAALAIAGGHVGFLSRCLRLFDVTPPESMPVVGWSAGAMVLTEHIVLYHDKGLEGVQPAELWDRGLGRARGVVAMPHARRRMVLDDLDRNRVLAHRFAPARIVLLDDGSRLYLEGDGHLPDQARVIAADGTVTTLGEEMAMTNGAEGEHDRAAGRRRGPRR
ncbi:MAG: hypothetical protein GXY39_10205 [Actinomycetales bacterium]|nr:hypothetical protein [Tetrasphaera sp.]NLX00062.1 hypothetical protein [Actinomycetales bacterium]